VPQGDWGQFSCSCRPAWGVTTSGSPPTWRSFRPICALRSSSATSWFADDVYALLRERNVALCVAESEELQVPQVVTADFGYFRMRKPPYTDEDVARIAVRVRGLVQTGFDQFVFFKHEEDPAGALEAEKLLRAA
jgi:uncharacterized protein YecE (DUF72 family)